jgi:hypothetical protein
MSTWVLGNIDERVRICAWAVEEHTHFLEENSTVVGIIFRCESKSRMLVADGNGEDMLLISMPSVVTLLSLPQMKAVLITHNDGMPLVCGISATSTDSTMARQQKLRSLSYSNRYMP